MKMLKLVSTESANFESSSFSSRTGRKERRRNIISFLFCGSKEEEENKNWKRISRWWSDDDNSIMIRVNEGRLWGRKFIDPIISGTRILAKILRQFRRQEQGTGYRHDSSRFQDSGKIHLRVSRASIKVAGTINSLHGVLNNIRSTHGNIFLDPMPSDISFFFFLPPPRSWIFRPVVNFDFKQNDRKRPKEKTKKKREREKSADETRGRGKIGKETEVGLESQSLPRLINPASGP